MILFHYPLLSQQADYSYPIYHNNKVLYLQYPNYYPLPDELGLCSISLISRRNAFLSKASQAYALLLKQLVDVGTWRMIGGA